MPSVIMEKIEIRETFKIPNTIEFLVPEPHKIAFHPRLWCVAVSEANYKERMSKTLHLYPFFRGC